MPRRFHPAFYIDNGLRSGVSCVGPLGDDRNPFLVQYLQFQCMPIEVFPNPTAPVTLTPKVACAMPAPWESSTLRIYQHDSSSVAHDFVRKTQKQKVTLLWKLLQNASVSPVSLNRETLGVVWAAQEETSSSIRILSFSGTFKSYEFLWKNYLRPYSSVWDSSFLAWCQKTFNNFISKLYRCTLDNVTFRLETSLVAAGGHQKFGKHAFVLHTRDSQVWSMKACFRNVWCPPAATSEVSSRKVTLSTAPGCTKWNGNKKQIKTMNITIWMISQNPAETKIQQLTLEHCPYKEQVQLVEARSSRTNVCHILWHPNGIPHAARVYEENQCASGSRSNNQSRLTCLDSLFTRLCASNIVFAAHHTMLAHSEYHNLIWPILHAFKLLWHH